MYDAEFLTSFRAHGLEQYCETTTSFRKDSLAYGLDRLNYFKVNRLLHLHESAQWPLADTAQSSPIWNRKAGEMLDARAKAEFKQHLDQLREELDEAREFKDEERTRRTEEEIDMLSRELSRAFGLAGRDRRAASDTERARINVTRAIKAAIERIAAHLR